MTAIPMLYAEQITSDPTDTGGAPWTTAVSLTTGEAWVANKEYLIFASALIECDTGASEHHIRLVHGTTPTEFTDGDCVIDPIAAGGGFWAFFMYRFTQPSTPEAITLELQGEGAATITSLMSQICAIQLTDYLTENTDFYWNEVTADYTTTSSFADQAKVTFTPNGTDDWLIIAHAVQIQASGQTSNVEMRLNDSVGGTTTPFLAMEGEDPDAGDEARHVGLVRMFTAPSAASRTYALQIRHTASETFTITSTRMLALKMNKFDQYINQYTDGIQSPAASPTWTTLATASVTPNVTGNWFYIGVGNGDMDATTAELNIRLQDDNSGSYASDPNYGDNGINPPAWNANNEIPHGLFKMKSLTSGASRTIRFEATRVAGSPNVKNATLVGFSAELAPVLDQEGFRFRGDRIRTPTTPMRLLLASVCASC
jgi:hypothetical protein